MNKAFDGAELLKRLKARVLPVIAPVAGDIIDWGAESLEINENGYMKLLGGVVRSIKAPLMEEINKGVAALNDNSPVANV